MRVSRFARATLGIVTMICLSRLTAAEAASSYATLYSFKGGTDGARPYGGITIGSGGVLYGTTFGGGMYQLGTVFKLTPVGGYWKEALVHIFTGPDGGWPSASLVFGDNGAMFGTTETGGSGAGTIFELTPTGSPGGWDETVLYTFDSTRNSQNHTPHAEVLIGPQNALYTTSTGGCCEVGTVVALDRSSTATSVWMGNVIYSFGPYSPAGGDPLSSLILVSGAFYGTTFEAGDAACGVVGCGTVYELVPPATTGDPWGAVAIHTFGSVVDDGGGPQASLTAGPGGVLYGTTYFGGSGGLCSYQNGNGCGTVFQLTPPEIAGKPWTETILHNFTGSNGDGAFPSGRLAVDHSGTLYGTTQYGGAGSSCSYYGAVGCGTVFKLDPPANPGEPWTEVILHNFTGQTGDGAVPIAGVTLSTDGTIYGTTSAGGFAGLGTIFKIW